MQEIKCVQINFESIEVSQAVYKESLCQIQKKQLNRD